MNRGALLLALGAAGAVGAAVAAARRPARGSGGRVALATRLDAPEPAAAALRLHGLAKALADQGVEVTVYTSTPPGARPPQDRGVSVRSLPALRDASGYIRGYAQYMSFDIPLVARLMAARRPDIIVAEPPPTTGAVVRVVAALRGVPYAYYAADVWSDAAASTGAPGWVVRAVNLVERFAVSGARVVLAVNDGVAQRAAQLGARHVATVVNGIDTQTFSPQGALAPDAPAAPYFLYAGTASEWQGAGIFIEALRLVHRTRPEAELVFLGQGSDWAALGEQAGEDPRIHLHDLVPAQEAAAWQRGAVASLVSIRPGLGYDFAYPTKIFAALACGTPVIYAGPGPARTDLPAFNLGWAQDYDAQGVAQAMLAALEAAEAPPAERRARAGHRRAWVQEHHSAAATAQRGADLVLGRHT